MDENQSKTSLNPMLIGGVVLAVIVIVGGVLFVSSNNSSQTNPAGSTTETMIVDDGTTTLPVDQSQDMIDTTDESAVKEFTLEAGSFYFKPNVINVKKGDTVRVTIDSVGGMMHDFVIDELSAKTTVAKSGESATVEFIADTAGSFQFYCSVGNHRAQGMVGTITVE